MSEGWETKSPVRLAYRSLIRRVIEDWVLGPVELLGEDDVAELEAVLRDEFPSGSRAGYLYTCWRAEVNLALGKEGDACRQLRNKSKKPGVDLRGLGEDGADWARRMGAKVARVPKQAPSLGELFGE